MTKPISDRLLRRFCAPDIRRRGDTVPTTLGRYTYAENGSIFIRVPVIKKYPRVAQRDLRGNQRYYETTIPSLKGMRFVPFDLPPAPLYAEQYCHRCDGAKLIAGDRSEGCTVCYGTGLGGHYDPVPVGNTFIAWHYLHLISLLPQPRLAFQPAATDFVPFRFDGGVGVVAPKLPI